MKVLLPKELRGTKFSKVLSIELNDFDIGRLLPGLFFLVVADGFGTSEKMRDDETVDKHLELLARHEDLVGFEGDEGKLLLERLVRTTLITTTRIAANRSKERVAAIKPYSLVALKTAETRGLRQTDLFTYQALKSVLQKEDNLKASLTQIFGKGVKITERPILDGKYDGHTDLDTLTRLSILFLDGFQSIPSRVKRDKENATGACPSLALAMGKDILSYLTAYHDLMPTQAFMYYLQGLLRFELYIYTLKLVHAINDLVVHPDTLPTAMREGLLPSQPQIYLDFTGRIDTASAFMARACMQQDIDDYQRFFTSNLLLRQLDDYVTKLCRPSSRLRTVVAQELKGSEDGPLYLQKLLLLQDHPKIGVQITALAMTDIDDIRSFNSQPNNDQDEDLSWLDAIANGGATEVESVVALLSEAQRGEAITKYFRWLWDVGGKGDAFSVIEGRRNSRSAWRYAPTNELLSVLIQLASVSMKPSEGQRVNDKGVYTIRLQDFLIFLERRFGILVDRPPTRFASAEYVAAARENLRAMLRRLRQMGIFRDLSDDFTAQRLRPPYAGEYLELVEA